MNIPEALVSLGVSKALPMILLARDVNVSRLADPAVSSGEDISMFVAFLGCVLSAQWPLFEEGRVFDIG
jgi:hypothetical protein